MAKRYVNVKKNIPKVYSFQSFRKNVPFIELGTGISLAEIPSANIAILSSSGKSIFGCGFSSPIGTCKPLPGAAAILALRKSTADCGGASCT